MTKSKDNRILKNVFWALLPVQAIAIGLPAINSLIDSFVVGNFYGAHNLAVIGFTDPLLMYISAVGSMLGTGSQLLCGQSFGAGDKEGIKRVFSSTLFLCILLGLPAVLLTQICPDVVAYLLGSVGETAANTSYYLRGVGFGMFASILISCLLPFLQLEQFGKICTICAAVMMVVNFAGDLLEVYVLKTGMFGIGLATSAASISAMLIALLVLLFKTKVFKFSIKEVNLNTCWKICYTGAPCALQPFLVIIRNRVLNHYIFALGGVVGMSAVSIATNITTATGCVIEAGYNGTGRLMSGILIGERDVESLKELPRIMIQQIWILFFIMYAIVFFFAKPLALIFGAPLEYIETYIWVIRLYNLWFFTIVPKAPSCNIYQGLGRIKLVSFLVFVDIVGYTVPLLLGFANRFGLYFVAASPNIADLLTVLTLPVIYVIFTHKLPKSMYEITDIPDSLAVKERDRFAATVQSIDEAVAVSQKLRDFALEKGLSMRKAVYCALCIEEMAVDAINNRFPSDKYTIDIRVAYENEQMHIMFRDNCPHFDPNEWLELCTPEEQLRSIGIKMVSAMATEMTYSSTLGLNVLNIVV